VSAVSVCVCAHWLAIFGCFCGCLSFNYSFA